MITTIGGYIGKIRKQYKEWGSPKYVWFRGEPDVKTRLLPRLYRPRRDGSFHDENKLLQMFRMKAPSFSPSGTPPKGNTDEWIFLAQHVGLPTRLLDWTENAILALYFALKEDKPIVWMLKPLELNAHVIKTLTGRKIDTYDEFPLTWHRPEPPLINIGHENFRGAWERDKKGIKFPVAVHPTYLHPRMSAQKSVFTVHGTDKSPLDCLIPANLITKFVIKPSVRHTIGDELAMLGIQESSAFPDLDGLTRELASLY